MLRCIWPVLEALRVLVALTLHFLQEHHVSIELVQRFTQGVNATAPGERRDALMDVVGRNA